MNTGNIQISSHHGVTAPWAASGIFSQHDAEQAQQFTLKMHSIVLWPTKMRSRSLNDNLASLRKVRNLEPFESGNKQSNCQACRTNIADHVTTMIGKVEAAIEGFYLKCVRHKGSSEKKCRIQHEDLARSADRP